MADSHVLSPTRIGSISDGNTKTPSLDPSLQELARLMRDLASTTTSLSTNSMTKITASGLSESGGSAQVEASRVQTVNARGALHSALPTSMRTPTKENLWSSSEGMVDLSSKTLTPRTLSFAGKQGISSLETPKGIRPLSKALATPVLASLSGSPLKLIPSLKSDMSVSYDKTVEESRFLSSSYDNQSLYELNATFSESQLYETVAQLANEAVSCANSKAVAGAMRALQQKLAELRSEVQRLQSDLQQSRQETRLAREETLEKGNKLRELREEKDHLVNAHTIEYSNLLEQLNEKERNVVATKLDAKMRCEAMESRLLEAKFDQERAVYDAKIVLKRELESQFKDRLETETRTLEEQQNEFAKRQQQMIQSLNTEIQYLQQRHTEAQEVGRAEKERAEQFKLDLESALRQKSASDRALEAAKIESEREIHNLKGRLKKLESQNHSLTQRNDELHEALQDEIERSNLQQQEMNQTISQMEQKLLNTSRACINCSGISVNTKDVLVVKEIVDWEVSSLVKSGNNRERKLDQSANDVEHSETVVKPTMEVSLDTSQKNQTVPVEDQEFNFNFVNHSNETLLNLSEEKEMKDNRKGNPTPIVLYEELTLGDHQDADHWNIGKQKQDQDPENSGSVLSKENEPVQNLANVLLMKQGDLKQPNFEELVDAMVTRVEQLLITRFSSNQVGSAKNEEQLFILQNTDTSKADEETKERINKTASNAAVSKPASFNESLAVKQAIRAWKRQRNVKNERQVSRGSQKTLKNSVAQPPPKHTKPEEIVQSQEFNEKEKTSYEEALLKIMELRTLQLDLERFVRDYVAVQKGINESAVARISMLAARQEKDEKASEAAIAAVQNSAEQAQSLALKATAIAFDAAADVGDRLCARIEESQNVVSDLRDKVEIHLSTTSLNLSHASTSILTQTSELPQESQLEARHKPAAQVLQRDSISSLEVSTQTDILAENVEEAIPTKVHAETQTETDLRSIESNLSIPEKSNASYYERGYYDQEEGEGKGVDETKVEEETEEEDEYQYQYELEGEKQEEECFEDNYEFEDQMGANGEFEEDLYSSSSKEPALVNEEAHFLNIGKNLSSYQDNQNNMTKEELLSQVRISRLNTARIETNVSRDLTRSFEDEADALSSLATQSHSSGRPRRNSLYAPTAASSNRAQATDQEHRLKAAQRMQKQQLEINLPFVVGSTSQTYSLPATVQCALSKKKQQNNSFRSDASSKKRLPSANLNSGHDTQRSITPDPGRPPLHPSMQQSKDQIQPPRPSSANDSHRKAQTKGTPQMQMNDQMLPEFNGTLSGSMAENASFSVAEISRISQEANSYPKVRKIAPPLGIKIVSGQWGAGLSDTSEDLLLYGVGDSEKNVHVFIDERSFTSETKLSRDQSTRDSFLSAPNEERRRIKTTPATSVAVTPATKAASPSKIKPRDEESSDRLREQSPPITPFDSTTDTEDEELQSRLLQPKRTFGATIRRPMLPTGLPKGKPMSHATITDASRDSASASSSNLEHINRIGIHTSSRILDQSQARLRSQSRQNESNRVNSSTKLHDESSQSLHGRKVFV